VKRNTAQASSASSTVLATCLSAEMLAEQAVLKQARFGCSAACWTAVLRHCYKWQS
jgi:hypothetical protein